MSISSIQAAKTQLEQRLKTLQDEVTRLSQDVQYTEDDWADRANQAFAKGVDQVLLAQLDQELDMVELALDRIDDGTYGTCLDCGAVIDPARLKVAPESPWCLSCSKKETILS